MRRLARNAGSNWKPKYKLWGNRHERACSGERTPLACWLRHSAATNFSLPPAELLGPGSEKFAIAWRRSPARYKRALPRNPRVRAGDAMKLPRTIAVLMGGPGSERKVSLATGAGISKAMRSLGIDVVDVDVRDENFSLPNNVDLAFIALHGTFGEDGQVQQILEDRGITYTGDGVKESEL